MKAVIIGNPRVTLCLSAIGMRRQELPSCAALSFSKMLVLKPAVKTHFLRLLPDANELVRAIVEYCSELAISLEV